jgi:hypothetical protein
MIKLLKRNKNHWLTSKRIIIQIIRIKKLVSISQQANHILGKCLSNYLNLWKKKNKAVKIIITEYYE